MIGDDLYEDISIDNFTFDAVNKGEVITMVRPLPDEWDIVEGTLRFLNLNRLGFTNGKMYTAYL